MSTQALDRIATGDIAADELRGILATRRRIRLSRRLIAVLLGLIAAGGIAWYGWDWWRVGRFIQTTDDAYVGGNVTTLSPHVAGFVAKILVGDNQFVHAGQLVVELDDRDYKANLAHADAVVQNQTAALANLRAKYTLQQSMIQQAEADLIGEESGSGFRPRGRCPLPCSRGLHLRFVADRPESLCRRPEGSSRRSGPARPASRPPANNSSCSTPRSPKPKQASPRRRPI